MATRFGNGRAATLAAIGSALCLWLASAPASAQCVGDCNDSGTVTITELVLGVNIALGTASVNLCPSFACSGGDTVPINCLVQGVNNALDGCPATPTATIGGPTDTPAATPSSTSIATATNTLPSTNTATATNTPVNTVTSTPTGTSVSTATITNTPVDTVTSTPTMTGGATATITNTPAATDTPGDTPTATEIPTPTATTVACPLTAGRYTQTTTGGALKVATFAPFTFPAGGVTIQDVSAGDANCVHTTVVPFPGGLTVPPFCVPALGATTSVTQSGCGIGEIDSDGGSDFTVSEVGDTSTTSICDVPFAGTCTGVGTPHACCTGPGTGPTCCPTAGPATDSSGRLDITVGDSIADTCASGTANALVTIPVNTLTWVAATECVGGTNDGTVCATDAQCTGGGTCSPVCPDLDGVFNPGTDTLLAMFPQTLDLTTDASSAKFAELGTPDGCFKSGLGPAGPYPNPAVCTGAGKPMACCTGISAGATCTGAKGTCIDIAGMTVSVAGSGTIFSSGGPTYDLLFETIQNSTVAGPADSGGATCADPPTIVFNGTATRCIVAP